MIERERERQTAVEGEEKRQEISTERETARQTTVTREGKRQERSTERERERGPEALSRVTRDSPTSILSSQPSAACSSLSFPIFSPRDCRCVWCRCAAGKKPALSPQSVAGGGGCSASGCGGCALCYRVSSQSQR